MNKNPSVSVVIAVHNEQAHVQRCLYSLLAQDYEQVEIVVVDDGSTDATVALVERLASDDGITLLRTAHLGAAAARNTGARAATGDVLAFVDGDMDFPAGWVRAMIAPMLADEEVYGTFTRDIHVANGHQRWARAHMLGRGLSVRTHFPEDFGDTFEIYRVIWTDRFWQVGGFDDIGHGEDVMVGRKLGRPAVVAPDGACWHHEPEDLMDIFRSARWLGSGERIKETPDAWKNHLPHRALKQGIRMAKRHRSPDLIAYRLVWSTGVLVGWFGKRWTAK